MNRTPLPLFLFLTLAALLPPPCTAKEPPTPAINAADLYHANAGILSGRASGFSDDFANFNGPADLEKLPAPVTDFLKEELAGKVAKNLLDASALATCDFCPGQKFLAEDKIANFKTLRLLARFARVYGWYLEKENKPGEALDLFLAIFTLGQRLEEKQILISAMVGLAIRKIAVESFQTLIEKNPAPDLREKLAAYLGKLPRPVMNVKKILEIELKYMTTGLDAGEKDPRLMKDIVSLGPEPKTPEKSEPLKNCLANQRVLLGAMEMLMMDYATIPPEANADFPAFLFNKKYLNKIPTCQEKGAYTVKIEGDGAQAQPTVRCSVHPTPDEAALAPAPPPAPEEVQKQVDAVKQLLAKPDWKKWRQELNSLMEEAANLDSTLPDLETRCKEINDRVEKSQNPLVQTLVPNFGKVHAQARDLQLAIDGFLKK